MEFPHGGDVEGYARAYGRAPLDFSANVSPLGLPEGVRRAAAEALARADEYPDPRCRALREAIASARGLAPEQVLCGGGAAELIFRLALALGPCRAVVTSPGFAEYESALRAARSEIVFHPLREEDGFQLTEAILPALKGAGLVFLCQPNNPTGLTCSRQLLLRVLELCRSEGAVLALDECFVPFLSDPAAHSLEPLVPAYPNLVVLRAFTKLYAMAGLRLGFALSSDEALLGAMRRAGPPWSVSVVAQAAGLAALREDGYVRDTRALLAREKPYLRDALARAGVRVVGGEANFLFFRSPDPALCEKLRARGILIRDCANYRGLGPGWCRAAVRTRADNDALARAVAEILSKGDGSDG